METKVITEATATFDEKFNILVQQMSRKGFIYKDMKIVDNHTANKITAVVIFEESSNRWEIANTQVLWVLAVSLGLNLKKWIFQCIERSFILW